MTALQSVLYNAETSAPLRQQQQLLPLSLMVSKRILQRISSNFCQCILPLNTASCVMFFEGDCTLIGRAMPNEFQIHLNLKVP